MTTKQRISQDWAFWRGFMDGMNTGEKSAREAALQYPHFIPSETQAYLQGSVDGSIGDLFRLNLLTRGAA